MKNKALFMVLVCAVVGLLAGAPLAKAELQMMTNSATTGWSALSPFNPNPITLQLPQFDSALGTLQQVTIKLASLEEATVSIENGSVNAVSGAYMTLTGNVRASNNVAGLITTAPIASTETVNLAANGQENGPIPPPTYNSMGADYHSFGLVQGSDQGEKTLTSNLSPFIGTGTIAVDVYGQGGWASSGTSDAQLNISGFQGKGDVQIIYTYEAIPEPAALGMLGLAGAALLYRRNMQRRNRRKV